MDLNSYGKQPLGVRHAYSMLNRTALRARFTWRLLLMSFVLLAFWGSTFFPSYGPYLGYRTFFILSFLTAAGGMTLVILALHHYISRLQSLQRFEEQYKIEPALRSVSVTEFKET